MLEVNVAVRKNRKEGKRERMDGLKPKPPSPPCKYHLLASLGKDKEERANNRPANYRSYTPVLSCEELSANQSIFLL